MGGETLDAALWLAPLPGGGSVYLLERDDLFAGGGLYGWRRLRATRTASRSVARGRAGRVLDFGFEPTSCTRIDWPTALAPAYLAELRASTIRGSARVGSVLTIHNAEYQGRFAMDAVALDRPSRRAAHRRPLRGSRRRQLPEGRRRRRRRDHRGVADHAREIAARTAAGLHAFFARRAASTTGILNGVDEGSGSAHDDFLARRFDQRPARQARVQARAAGGVRARAARRRRCSAWSRAWRRRRDSTCCEPLAAALDEGCSSSCRAR